MAKSVEPHPPLPPHSRLTLAARAGLWLAAPMALLQAVNVLRVFSDPQGFARYMGAPLIAAGDAAWVQIYALRAAFIALLVTLLLARRDATTLKWIALAALVMPLGDAWVAYGAGADAAIVGRHLATALYILVVYGVLAWGARGAAR